MTDHELLELAAKAAGFDVRQTKAKVDGLLIAGRFNGDYFTWNPLIDDGDALRLAVKLRMLCDFSNDDVECTVFNGETPRWVGEADNGDRQDCTRRAIVRAAAEIGRGMK